MAERLGEALLELRTNDAGFNAGIAQAEGRAQKLGSTLDRTSGSSAKLASEMAAAGRSAQVMGAGVEQAGQRVEQAGKRVVQSASAQLAGMQQLSSQLGDIATMYALGARPMQIFASQSGQVIQAIQMMSGGTSRLAAFMGGPWGIAITSAAVVLAPFIGKLFEAEDALEGVAFASSRLGDAQSILGSVVDETTGKINVQSQAMLALARAQAVAGMVGAMQRQAAAGAEMQSIRQGGLGDLRAEFSMGGLHVTRANKGQDVVDLVMRGRLSAAEAEQQLRARMESGVISQEAYFRAAQAITAFDAEGANVVLFRDTLAGLDGDSAAARRILGGSGGGRGGGSGGGRGGATRAGVNQAGADARFESDLIAVTQRILQARLQIATSAEERAELAARGVEWDRRDALAAIAAREDLSDAQRVELRAATNRLADAELEAIEFRKRVEQARAAQDLADERFRGEAEALENARALADTEAERKAIALRLLEAEERLERLRLSTIIAAAETDEAERARAQQALDNLNANSEGRRAAVARQNETETERYLRGLNATPGMINEAIDGIKIDGLEALNDGLTRAIMGVESLGDVFSRVADQIIADLLRIAIQQAIIKPLAGALFGGGGGGLLGGLFGGGGPRSSLLGSVNSLFEGAFAGLFAKGGTIPTGQFGIVGEEGPEIAFAGPGGLGILSNSDSRKLIGSPGGPSIAIPITIDATGADAAAIARLNARLDQLSAELPGRIVATVQEARERRVIR
ncbi:hypothetical protein [Erythrobacter tepidarius]|uniref:hypothetical protein n=1 Tax=Erythrobacter tepidarius TaxID=60454 RepID=UPI000A372737|nr:hypothetical protein [Erythrobacter tepidarius]